jgi:hypothetical protein
LSTIRQIFGSALPVVLTAKLWPCLRLPHVIKCAKEKIGSGCSFLLKLAKLFISSTTTIKHSPLQLLPISTRSYFGKHSVSLSISKPHPLVTHFFNEQRSPSTTAMSYGGYGGSRGGSNGYDFGRDSQSRGNYSSGYSNGYDNLWSRYCCEVWRSPPPPVAKSIWTAHF